MSTPAPHGALNQPTDPRSGDAFKAACARHDFMDLQDALRGMTKRDAVDHLQALFPDKAREWLRRNLPHLMALEPAAFLRTLGYADPTGDLVAEADARGVRVADLLNA